MRSAGGENPPSMTTGGGAATASGVSFQSRVAAYMLATAVCDVPTPLTSHRRIKRLGLETRTAVDDINIELVDGTMLYLQAKANVAFSFTTAAPLRGAFEQFIKQHLSSPGEYLLVVSPRVSRSITIHARLALDQHRQDSLTFQRDQPAIVVNTFNDLLAGVREIASAHSHDQASDEIAKDVLHRTYITAVDVEPGGTLEHTVTLVLASQHYIRPDLLWPKLISDCVDYARSRSTVSIDDQKQRLAHFRASPENSGEASNTQALEFMGPLPVAKEVVLGRQLVGPFPDGTTPLIELRRFDDDCSHRINFENGKCIIGDGLFELEVLRRTATFSGMDRFINSHPDPDSLGHVIIVPMAGGDDIETTLCAERHRQRLSDALKVSQDPLRCIGCGKTLTSNDAELIERENGEMAEIGGAHPVCVEPLDRVLGQVRVPFFEQYDFLVNFDIDAWVEALPSGQRGLRGIPRDKRMLVWGGRKLDIPPGNWVVEAHLANGDREYLRNRGVIERESRISAEHTADAMNASIEKGRAQGDPRCYTKEGRAYGQRSALLQQVGASDELVEVTKFCAVPYKKAMEAYSTVGNHYAPLAYIRSTDGGLLHFDGLVPVVSDPWNFERYFQNWRDVASIDLDDYEVATLAYDRQFDDFAHMCFSNELGVIVDLMLDPAGKEQFISGLPIVPESYLEQLAAETQERGDDGD